MLLRLDMRLQHLDLVELEVVFEVRLHQLGLDADALLRRDYVAIRFTRLLTTCELSSANQISWQQSFTPAMCSASSFHSMLIAALKPLSVPTRLLLAALLSKARANAVDRLVHDRHYIARRARDYPCWTRRSSPARGRERATAPRSYRISCGQSRSWASVATETRKE